VAIVIGFSFLQKALSMFYGIACSKVSETKT
jgi:hypothetical protein